MRLRAPVSIITCTLLATALAACGSGSTSGSGPAPSSGSSSTPSGPPGGTDVVLVTHDSWSLPKSLIASFEQKTGYHLVVRSSGDAGQLTNKLVLSSGNPDGDVSFGVDNTFAGRALSNGVFAAYKPKRLPAGAAAYDVPNDNGDYLTPIDHSAVCVNVDKDWFTAHHIPAPTSMADLVKPEYKNLFVTEGAPTSSPGMAFLLATIATYGTSDSTGWQTYWKELLANGMKVDDGWDQAYDVDFTQGGGNGDRPIVTSYDSDPAATVKNGRTSTAVLQDTCFGEVEYAGVLTGAKNAPGAEAFIRFLLSRPVQKALPGSMYVYPVASGTPLPADWKKFAVQPAKPLTLDPTEINDNRDEWLQQWTDLVSQ